MPPLFFGKALLVNLDEKTVEEKDLPDELFTERIGGAAISSALMKNAEGRCISIGSGPLTGAPCPAASAAIIGIKEEDGSQKFAPILLNAGLEFKLSGFDFVIIEGRTESPVYLWIRDQVADLVDCDHLSTANSWSTASQIKGEQGDPRIQVIAASSGDCASIDYVTGWDGIGIGATMRLHNLKAIAFRGLGELEIGNPQDFLIKGSEMMKAAKERVGSKAGIRSLVSSERASRIEGITRNRACFSCPFPCLSYVKTGKDEPESILLMDQKSLSVLTELSFENASVIDALIRLHRDGRSADNILIKSNISLDKIVDSDFQLSESSRQYQSKLDTITEGIAESREIAVGYVLGLCPRYVGIMKPDLESYFELLNLGLGEEIDRENILELGRSLTK